MVVNSDFRAGKKTESTKQEKGAQPGMDSGVWLETEKNGVCFFLKYLKKVWRQKKGLHVLAHLSLYFLDHVFQ